MVIGTEDLTYCAWSLQGQEIFMHLEPRCLLYRDVREDARTACAGKLSKLEAQVQIDGGVLARKIRTSKRIGHHAGRTEARSINKAATHM